MAVSVHFTPELCYSPVHYTQSAGEGCLDRRGQMSKRARHAGHSSVIPVPPPSSHHLYLRHLSKRMVMHATSLLCPFPQLHPIVIAHVPRAADVPQKLSPKAARCLCCATHRRHAFPDHLVDFEKFGRTPIDADGFALEKITLGVSVR